MLESLLRRPSEFCSLSVGSWSVGRLTPGMSSVAPNEARVVLFIGTEDGFRGLEVTRWMQGIKPVLDGRCQSMLAGMDDPAIACDSDQHAHGYVGAIRLTTSSNNRVMLHGVRTDRLESALRVILEPLVGRHLSQVTVLPVLCFASERILAALPAIFVAICRSFLDPSLPISVRNHEWRSSFRSGKWINEWMTRGQDVVTTVEHLHFEGTQNAGGPQRGAMDEPLGNQRCKTVLESITVVGAPHVLDAVPHAAAAASATRLAAFLSNLPPNILGCATFVDILRCMTIDNVACDIIQGEELAKAGLGLLYSVGVAAEAAGEPPALAVLHYTGHRRQVASNRAVPKKVALIGKGIMFDTGGMCLKNMSSMRGMKHDMAGAAAVLAAFIAYAQDCNRQIEGELNHNFQPVDLYAVLCIAENQISPRAVCIDDVIRGYSDLTVEVNNTDAEGRLVLADGIAYCIRALTRDPESEGDVARPFDALVDIATLTGAQAIATGKRIAAIYARDAELEKQIIHSGRQTGEWCHPLPYAPELWLPTLSSQVADLKNAVTVRDNCPSACAATFIEQHLLASCANQAQSPVPSWAHIDMAAPATDTKGERSTGFGAALLYHWLSTRTMKASD